MAISPGKAELIVTKLRDKMMSDYEAFRKGRIAGLLEVFKMIHTEGDFILELIQNADDADSENLFVDWMGDWLIVRNDGDPFEEVEGDLERQNVSAICEFNKTTKFGSKIGFMGIGFKSVFHVSDHVEVYSGPFRFYLDERMCVPEWISTPKGPFESLLPEVSHKGSMFCVETLSNQEEELERVRETLDRLSMTVVLWLQKLSNIHIGGKTITKRKGMLSDSFILTDGSKSELYRCFYSDQLKVEGDALKELVKARKGIRSDWAKMSVEKSVGISFTVDKDGRIVKKEGQCYAFLPLPEVRLRTAFDIHGDFNVELRRKALKREGDSYNDWLFSQTGLAWGKAFNCYKGYSSPELALQMYRIAPTDASGELSADAEGERRYPFRIIKKGIDDYMRGFDTVLIEVSRGIGGHRNIWKRPSESAIPLQGELRHLFDHKDLQTLLGREMFWISSSLPEEGVPYLQEFVDVRSLDALDFVTEWSRFEAIAGRKARRRDAYRWFAGLSIALSDLYNHVYDNNRYANRGQDAKQKIVETFPILLSSGKVTNKKEGNQIFYLPPRRKKLKEIGANVVLKSIQPGVIAYLRKKTNDEEENERRENALDFLKKHILTVLDPKGQFETVIRPKLESVDPNELGQRYLDSVVVFVFQNKDCWEPAKNLIPLLAEDGKWQPPNSLYLSSVYGGSFDATSFFRGIHDDALLSARYARMLSRPAGKKKDQKAEIRDFFQELGVNLKPAMSTTRNVISEEELEARIGRKPGSTRSTGYLYYGYDLEDSDFSDGKIRDVLTQCAGNQGVVQGSFVRLSAFLTCLIGEWRYFSESTKAHYYRYDPDWTKVGRQSKTKEDAGPSAWVHFLSKSDLRWIPAKLGGNKLHVSPKEALLPDTSAVSSLPVVCFEEDKGGQFQANLADFKEFFKSMGWEAVPGIDETIAELHIMCDCGVNEKRLFMKKYQTLMAQTDSVSDPTLRAELVARLDSRPWIFTPGRKERYRTSVRVQWESRGGLFDWKVGIEKDYPGLERFFKEVIRISPCRAEDLVLFLQNKLWRKSRLSKKELEELYRVYTRLDLLLSDENDGQLGGSVFWQDTKPVFKFYCNDNSWHEPKDDLYFVNDAGFMKELSKAGVKVVAVRLSRSLEARPPSNLFGELKVSPLTNIKLAPKPSYDSTIDVDGDSIKDELRLTLESLGPIIKGINRKLFETLSSRRDFESLASADVAHVKGLRIVTPLQTGESIEKGAEVFIHRNSSGNATVLISAALRDSHDRTVKLLCKELDRVLGGVLGGDFVYLVWGKKRSEAFENARIFKNVLLKRPREEVPEYPKELTPAGLFEGQAGKEIVITPGPTAAFTEIVIQTGTRPRRVRKRAKEKPSAATRMEWSRQAVEARAINLILNYENENREDKAFVAIDVHEAKPGYDIAVVPHQIDSRSFDEKKHEHLLKKFIEVKSSKTDSDDFVITEREWNKAKMHGERYFIYRMVDSMSDNPTAYVIRDPVTQYGDALVEKTARVIEDWRKRTGVKMTPVHFKSRSQSGIGFTSVGEG